MSGTTRPACGCRLSAIIAASGEAGSLAAPAPPDPSTALSRGHCDLGGSSWRVTSTRPEETPNPVHRAVGAQDCAPGNRYRDSETNSTYSAPTSLQPRMALEKPLYLSHKAITNEPKPYQARQLGKEDDVINVFKPNLEKFVVKKKKKNHINVDLE